MKKGLSSGADDATGETIKVIEELLSSGLMHFGVLTDRGFESWDLGPDETLKRLGREMAALGREPRLGDIGWLANTAAGDEKADEILRNHAEGDGWVSGRP